MWDHDGSGERLVAEGLFEDRHAFMELVDLDSGVVAAANHATTSGHSWNDEEISAVSLDQIRKQSIQRVRAKDKPPLVSLVNDTSGRQSTDQASRSSNKTTGGRE